MESGLTDSTIRHEVVWSVEEMRSADAATIEVISRTMAPMGEGSSTGGSASFVLMRRAGEAVARVLSAEIAAEDRVVVLAGTGNNGGDGLVVARALWDRGIRVEVVVAEGGTRTAEWVEAAQEWEQSGGQSFVVWSQQSGVRRGEGLELARKGAVERGEAERRDAKSEHPVTLCSDEEIDNHLSRATILVDALLGIGQRGSPRGAIARLVEAARRRASLANPACRIVALDIPTGVCADSGRLFAPWLPAHQTIAVQGMKRGCLVAPSFMVCGALRAVEVGISGEREPLGRGCFPRQSWIEIPWPPNAHKFDRGKVVVLGGEQSMPGAPALVSEAALRVGAGLVVHCRTSDMDQSLIRPEIIRVDVGAGERFELRHRDRVMEALSTATAIVIGPGMGRAEETGKLLVWLLVELAEKKPDVPLVIDADGLSLLAQLKESIPCQALKGRWILTPHYGEAARLLEVPSQRIVDDPFFAAQQLAHRFSCTAVLKGAGTIIADDTNYWIVPPAAIGLATAGSGDVLAGIMGGLCAQARAREERGIAQLRHLSEVAIEAVTIQGLAAQALGDRGFIAHDIVGEISTVVRPVVDPGFFARTL